MSDRPTGTLDRRTVMTALGVSSLAGLTGYVGTVEGKQDRQPDQMEQTDGDHDGMFERIPAIDLPVIDGYYEGETAWFIHTSTSSQKMAKMLSEMVNYPTYYVPKLDEVVDIDALADIYVFTNGVDRSNAEPWGGGPFGYQIDLLDSVSSDKERYTPIRHANMVSWKDDAEPRILKSVDELTAAKEAGKLTIKRTDVAVTAPVVSWPGGPGRVHTSRGSEMSGDCPMCGGSEMADQCPMCNGSNESGMMGGSENGSKSTNASENCDDSQ